MNPGRHHTSDKTTLSAAADRLRGNDT